MPFNSTTYYRNKYLREAKGYLAEARRRRARGDCLGSVANAVKLARSNMRSFHAYRSMGECNDELKLVHAGKMPAREFIEKWGATT